MLTEGVRDVVAVSDAAQAVQSALGSRPPVFLLRVLDEVQHRFAPRLIGRMHERGAERLARLSDCIRLSRAWSVLHERINELERLANRQLLDDLLLSEGETERYLGGLPPTSATRVLDLPRFRESRRSFGPIDAREPRLRGRLEFLEDSLATVRQHGLLDPMGADGIDALHGLIETHSRRPLYALRECVAVIQGKFDALLSEVDKLQLGDDPLAVLRDDCLQRYRLGVLPPGIVISEYIMRIIESRAQPPEEVYLAWVIDLRDLRPRLCGDLLDQIWRRLSADSPWALPDRAAEQPREKPSQEVRK
jgi:hypothetical protein